MNEMKTLAGWCLVWGVTVDSVRQRFVRTPALQNLGQLFGRTRAYDARDAAKIKAAIDEYPSRVKARKAAEAAAASA